MNHRHLLPTLFVLLLGFISAHRTLAQAPPQVISVTPESGDSEVSYDLREVIVRFDRDMSPGRSVMNTANSPKMDGGGYWKDTRTFVMPVNLKPNTLYSVQLNSHENGNFRSKEGISLPVTTLFFRTAKATEGKKLNKAAYRQLATNLRQKYAYHDRLGIDWDQRLRTFEHDFISSDTRSEFALHLIKFFEAAEDPHISVELHGDRFGTGWSKPFHVNHNLNDVFQKLQNRKKTRFNTVISGTIDNTGYIAIRSWTNMYRNAIITAIDRLKELQDMPNLIIDVRDNGGGNDALALEFASYFVDKTTAFEKVRVFNEETGSYDKEIVHEVSPQEEASRYKGNVYLLVGNKVMSSNESFVLMMKQAPNTKVVGMTTYGSSGNPKPFELKNGVTIYLPSWQAYTLNDELIEGTGVKPDVEIVTKASDFNNEDYLLQKVLAMINEQN